MKILQITDSKSLEIYQKQIYFSKVIFSNNILVMLF